MASAQVALARERAALSQMAPAWEHLALAHNAWEHIALAHTALVWARMPNV